MLEREKCYLTYNMQCHFLYTDCVKSHPYSEVTC